MTAVSPSPETRRSLRSRLPLPPGPFIGFLVAILAVVVIALFTYRSIEVSAITAARVQHTQDVIEQTEALLSTFKDAEASQRGFLLTKEERYLTPFTDAKAALPGELQAIRTLTAENPIQQRRLATLDELTKQKLTELEQTITLGRADEYVRAIAIVRTDLGHDLMERIRSVTAEIERDERAHLAAREADWEDTARNVAGDAVRLGAAAHPDCRRRHDDLTRLPRA